MRSFPVVYMRGGTSKGLVFLENDLPCKEERDNVFLQCMGNPDPKQIDGMGGCVSSNNKIVIVRKSKDPNFDVEYLVGQCVVGKNRIDYSSNCGNMTAAVGPFAVDAGLVDKISEPFTTVRLLNLNTGKTINERVPVRNGRFDNSGGCRIAGVEKPAGELLVSFLNPGGSKTGRLFPTGNRTDILPIPGMGDIPVTIIDVSNPLVLVSAGNTGATGDETPSEVDANVRILSAIEAVRAAACVRLGFASDAADASENSPAVPKAAFFSFPRNGEADISVRVMSMGKCHKACPLTAAQAVACARVIPGTLLNDTGVRGDCRVSIAHPSGITEVGTDIVIADDENGSIEVRSASVIRTARVIMNGRIYITD